MPVKAGVIAGGNGGVAEARSSAKEKKGNRGAAGEFVALGEDGEEALG
jgi:hypothetical protein